MSGIQLNLSFLTLGAAASPAYLIYCAMEEEQGRLITLLVQEHAANNYEDAAATLVQIEGLTKSMREITNALSDECESLHLELLKATNPVSHRSLVKTMDSHDQRRSELYDERFFDKTYKGDDDDDDPTTPAEKRGDNE